jgi:hypothetical protein
VKNGEREQTEFAALARAAYPQKVEDYDGWYYL